MAFSGCSLQIGGARYFLGIEDDLRCIFTDRDDARREAFAHAANDVRIVDWSRTARINTALTPQLHERLSELARDGVRVRVGETVVSGRRYVLVEGPAGVDPNEFTVQFPQATWYDPSIIALAIEPFPADALPLLEVALGAGGAPDGVRTCERAESTLVVEFVPEVTRPALILRIIDVELARFAGFRRMQLLTPLPVQQLAAIAAEGLQAPEIAPDRILETLLDLERVE